jgi:peptide/nickel transport system permease protein
MATDERTFDRLDWAETDPSRTPGATDLLAVSLFAALAALFAYDYLAVPKGPDMLNEVVLGHRLRWDPAGFDWLVLLSLVVFVTVVVVPLATNRTLARRYWRRLRTDRLALASLAYLSAFVFLGTFGPALLGRPDIQPALEFQPPVLMRVESTALFECAGRVTSVGGTEYCYGSWQYPLGTDTLGRAMSTRLVQGMQVSLLMALVVSMLMVPIAALVGTLAGYLGGRVDDVLMRYVDVQQTVPAVLVYLVLVYLFTSSLFLIVLVFGLLSWGGLARMIRSEVLQRKQETYITAARAAGASRWGVVRHHLLPNASNTVVTAVTIQIPTLILAEAGLGYLGIGERYSRSFGQLIQVGLDPTSVDFAQYPWMATEAAVLLAVTALAFNVLGDALRDAMDPRGER